MNESQKLLQSLKNAPEHTLSVRELCKISGKTPEEVRRLLAEAPQGEPVFRADGTVALTRDVLTEGNLLAQTPLSGLTVLDTVDSTNRYLKDRADELPDRYAVIALSQTQGRGRLGRRFCSDGRGLYMSLLLKPDQVGEKLTRITTMAAAAAALAGEEVTRQTMRIKWVNDLYFRGRKIAGILTEGVFSEKPAVILGIGVNLFEPAGGFDPAVADVAGALFEENNFLAEDFTAALLNHFFEFYEERRDYLPEYRQRMMLTGQTVTYERNGSLFEARVLGVDDDCRLLVCRENRTEALFSGEISLKTFDKC